MDASTIDEKADMKGPTANCNWVIPGKLIAGAYPGGTDSHHDRDAITAIIDAGVTIIVCLMPEKEVALFTPYREIASQYAAEEMREVEFISFPIPDGFITMDSLVLEFIPKLAERVSDKSECVYVHCRCGHGRAGTIVALLLARLYGISAEYALHLTGLFHSQREKKTMIKSPQTRAQRGQVMRLTPQLHRQTTPAAD